MCAFRHALRENPAVDLLSLIPQTYLKACGGQTPATSDSTFGNRDDMASEMVESSTRAPLRHMKALCLKRDDYRCVLSGRFAKEAVGRHPTVPDNEIRRNMLTAHILLIMPFALGSWSNDMDIKKKSNTWTTMFALFPSLESVIKPEQINVGRNLMILSGSLNDEFGALELALEPTDDDRTYKIVTYPNFSGSEAHYFPPADGNGTRLVTFHHHGGPLELPSRTLLSTHSAVARILHACIRNGGNH
ncbi:hypothetical protein SI65_02985 [Aspergillus cristatus]|uniref:HNH nuclease domain-containing protein n=1 Tax=Aspergillus cristatus TaxID=573508 RepID=A0A1E3BMH6_ASPCR|nr:hypothetical protein SI65_02985 [Aspergillus cristatus]